MQAIKNWCDGERVKKLGTLRQTKQGAIRKVAVWNAPGSTGLESKDRAWIRNLRRAVLAFLLRSSRTGSTTRISKASHTPEAGRGGGRKQTKAAAPAAPGPASSLTRCRCPWRNGGNATRPRDETNSSPKKQRNPARDSIHCSFRPSHLSPRLKVNASTKIKSQLRGFNTKLSEALFSFHVKILGPVQLCW
jgi:hypothetical protein